MMRVMRKRAQETSFQNATYVLPPYEICKDQAEDEQVSAIPNDEYVVVLQPLFDYEAENRLKGKDMQEGEDVFEVFKNEANGEIKRNLIDQPAKDYPDRKWVMLWEGWKYLQDCTRRAKYCSPDRFGMYIYNDFEGWGLQELMENMVSCGIAVVVMAVLLTKTGE